MKDGRIKVRREKEDGSIKVRMECKDRKIKVRRQKDGVGGWKYKG